MDIYNKRGEIMSLEQKYTARSNEKYIKCKECNSLHCILELYEGSMCKKCFDSKAVLKDCMQCEETFKAINRDYCNKCSNWK